MFSSSVPASEREALAQQAGGYVLGHPGYFQGANLVTTARTFGLWSKDVRPLTWRTEAMLQSIIDARPWRHLAKRWPRPITFCIHDPNFTKLWNLIINEVRTKAEWLWWRHHSLYFRDTTGFSSAMRAYINKRKSICSMPGRIFRSVYIHVAELVHQNICTPQILEDVCFPRISRSLVYLEPPSTISSYAELEAFFKAEDSKHPWRMYYAGRKLSPSHPFFADLDTAQRAIYRFTPDPMVRSLISRGKADRYPHPLLDTQIEMQV